MQIEGLVSNEFSRNIGLLTEAEQRLLLGSKVAVAGAGGVGGLHALTLARLGVGKFHIADFDTFEPANVSRQFGAGKSTFGRNKADVLAEMVLDINPQAEIRIFADGVTEQNIDDFLGGATLFIDGIEFFEIDIRRLLFCKAREKGIYSLTAAPLGFGATIQIFSPKGMSFDEYFGIDEGMSYLEKLASFAAGLAPHPFHIRYLDTEKVDIDRRRGPAVAPACTLAASLLATEAMKIITGKGHVRVVPCYLQFDMLLRKFKTGRIYGGGKNPLHRLRRALILRKFRNR